MQVDSPAWAAPLRVIAALDWSAADPSKRQLALATRADAELPWRVEPVRRLDQVCAPQQLGAWLSEQAGQGAALLGLDLALGVPAAWAALAGVSSLRDLLAEAGEGRWAQLFDVAERPDQISLTRPFYPRVGQRGQSQRQLVEALGLPDADALRRACDMPRVGQPTPCPLFWTMGANQVGKGALAGWRELVKPALRDPRCALWPADGALDALAAPSAVILSELYPADAASWLGLTAALRAAGGKRAQAARQAAGAQLNTWLDAASVLADAALIDQMGAGFGEGGAGEDAFDAAVGLCGLLMLARGERRLDEPAASRELEGWIIGREV